MRASNVPSGLDQQQPVLASQLSSIQGSLFWVLVLNFTGIVLPHLSLFTIPLLSLSKTTWMLSVACFSLIGFGSTVIYHRYLAHRSFQTTRLAQFIGAVVACTNLQGGPLLWSANHRWHHRYADSDADIHSPVRHGFMHAHIGWLFRPQSLSPDYRYVQDLSKFPELVYLDKLWLLPGLCAATICYLIDGWAGLVVGYFLPVVIAKQLAFCVNSFCHVSGSQPYLTGDGSRNNAILGLLAGGEGWHNNHHALPRSARHGWEWYEVDLSFWAILALEKMGLIWDVDKRRGPHGTTDINRCNRRF